MKSLTIAVSMTAVFALSSCGGGNEKAASEAEAETAAASGAAAGVGNAPRGNSPAARWTQGYVEIANAMSNVTDEASAQRAAETIQRVGVEMEEISARLEDDPAAQRAFAMQLATNQDFLAASTRASMAISSIAMSNPEAARMIGEAFENLPSPN